MYYRCAIQRQDEAKVLFKAGFTTGAVYLSGYGVECMLKALVLEATPEREQVAMLGSFKSGRGHDYEWLRALYLMRGGVRFSREIARHFTLVGIWSTELRYMPRSLRAEEAKEFLDSSSVIIQWADGRL